MHLCVVCVSKLIAMDPPGRPDRSVEVCREFLRKRCDRSEGSCRYAHPPEHCQVISGRVTCCVDSIQVYEHRTWEIRDLYQQNTKKGRK